MIKKKYNCFDKLGDCRYECGASDEYDSYHWCTHPSNMYSVYDYHYDEPESKFKKCEGFKLNE
jgi:hypothetical protein